MFYTNTMTKMWITKDYILEFIKEYYLVFFFNKVNKIMLLNGNHHSIYKILRKIITFQHSISNKIIYILTKKKTVKDILQRCRITTVYPIPCFTFLRLEPNLHSISCINNNSWDGGNNILGRRELYFMSYFRSVFRIND